MSVFDDGKRFELGLLAAHAVSDRNRETDYKSGHEIAAEAVLKAYMTPAIAIGVHAYASGQITGDTGPGAILGPHKGQAAGLGPAMMWLPAATNGRVSISAKVIHDVYTVQRYKRDALHVNLG